MERCIACGRPFAKGDDVVTFRLERVRAGEKSDALGFYDHPSSPNQEEERVHFNYSCLEKGFSPADNPFLYDSVVASIRQEIYEDEKEVDHDLPPIDEDPPFCLWCKREDTVWMQIQRDMYIYNCLACQKLWDHNEEEMYWDHERGQYIPVDID